jgi:putative RNA 2'-phosphotransferase
MSMQALLTMFSGWEIQVDAQLVRKSKFISLVLRHRPEQYGLVLDEQGWAQIDDLIAVADQAGAPLTREQLQQVVDQNDKQRFAISADKRAIRARQGHSIAVDLQFTAIEPPPQLYHGTAEHNLESIRVQGLLRRTRRHVHLSADEATAIRVGRRHGMPVVLIVEGAAMQRDGYAFYRSENGVWLVDAVPVEYIVFPSQQQEPTRYDNLE